LRARRIRASRRARRAKIARPVGASGCGRDLPHEKPHPLIFQLAAEELRLPPLACVLKEEDASLGFRAAKAGGMAALGLARLSDEPLLAGAELDLVVSTLDEVALERLGRGST